MERSKSMKSRLRCCYAQGLTAVGDERVPEVVRFSQSIGAPLIPSDASVGNFLESFWNDTLRLTHLAKVGNREVKEHYSEDSATQHWIKLIKYLA